MRKIDLRISDARKRLADSIYEKQAIEIDRRYSHLKLNDLTYPLTRQEEKVQYYQIGASWIKEKVHARLETYLEAFRKENVVPNDLDLSEMSWAFKEVADSVTSTLPEELQRSLNQLVDEHIIPDARRDIKIFIQDLRIEQIEAKDREPRPVPGHTYNMYINENRGPVQQGGEGNAQNINQTNEREDYQYYKERFSCPHCGAETTTLVNNDDVDYTEYACGYAYGGNYNNPCPHNPEFPTLDEYEMEVRGKDNRWYCHPKPKTKAARKLTLDGSWAETPEEAKARVAKQYDFRARNVPKNKKTTK